MPNYLHLDSEADVAKLQAGDGSVVLDTGRKPKRSGRGRTTSGTRTPDRQYEDVADALRPVLLGRGFIVIGDKEFRTMLGTGIPVPPLLAVHEWRFAYPDDMRRSDWYFPDGNLLVEIEGGLQLEIIGKGGGVRRGGHHAAQKDMDKYNDAVCRYHYRLLRFESDHTRKHTYQVVTAILDAIARTPGRLE